ncbi:MAG: hypothetical protein IPL96_03405 [Holophagaceae bacterium]|nr:hypothetical protein [Holophagaceae bacterium]
MKKELICLLGMASGGPAIIAQEIPAHDPFGQRRFLKEIDFEARAQRISSEGGMVGPSLPDPAQSPQLANGWQNQDEMIYPSERSTFYNKGKEQLEVTYYYFEKIQAAKVKFLWVELHGYSGSKIPRISGPKNLGDISLVGINNSIDTITFWKKNLIVKIRRYESNFDTMGLAHWIHDHLTLVPPEEVTRQVPTPQKVIVGLEKSGPETSLVIYPSDTASANSLAARVGETIVIRVTPPSGAPEDRYDLKQQMGEYFQPVGLESPGRLDRAIKAMKPGSAVFKYVLVDRQTLLSYRGEIKIEIQP